MNKAEYISYVIKNSLHLNDIRWFIELFSIIIKDGVYDYIKIENGVKFVKMGDSYILSDASANEAILRLDDVIKVKSGTLSILEEDIYTSMGILLSNALFLEYPFGKRFKYINNYFRHKDLIKMITPLLDSGEITVNELSEYSSAISYSQNLNKLFVYSSTTKTVTPAPGMEEYKKKMSIEFDEKYGKEWKKDNALALEFISRLKEYDNEYIKDDPSYGKVMSGGLLSNSRPREYMAFGVEYGFDDKGTDAKFIMNSLLDGYPMHKEELKYMFNTARKGTFDRGSETQQAGLLLKELQRATNALKILDGDCKTKDGSPVIINNENVEWYENVYIIEDGKTVLKKDLKEYIGKEVIIRSTMHCKSINAYCSICTGAKLDRFREGITLLIITVSGILLNSKMKSFHKATKETMNFNIIDTIK